jgi:hypothetical protein
MHLPKTGFYRVKVEERASSDGTVPVLVLHVYRDGIEVETLDFDLSPSGSQGLIDEVRWLEFRHGHS